MQISQIQVVDVIEQARVANGKPEHKPGDFGIAELVSPGACNIKVLRS
jgi:hypothetical protein